VTNVDGVVEEVWDGGMSADNVQWWIERSIICTSATICGIVLGEVVGWGDSMIPSLLTTALAMVLVYFQTKSKWFK
jgi:hypothetical protein